MTRRNGMSNYYYGQSWKFLKLFFLNIFTVQPQIVFNLLGELNLAVFTKFVRLLQNKCSQVKFVIITE